jgi:L,D-transpeptidase YcbB
MSVGRTERLVEFTLFLLFLLAFCASDSAIPSSATFASPSASQLQPLTLDGQALLRRDLQSAYLPALCSPDFSAYQADATTLYSALDGTLAWVQDGKPTSQSLALIQAFEQSAYKGLEPEDYDASRWHERLAEFDQSVAPSESALVAFDLEVTVSALRYVSDLQNGRINPQSLGFEIGVNRSKLALPTFLNEQLMRSGDVNAALASLDPPFPIYRRTENALATYLDLIGEGDGEPLALPKKPVKPKANYPELQSLVARLKLLGDLSQQYLPIDSFYEGAVVDGVKHFQNRQGLEPNGVLDAATVKELNIPLSRRMEQLELTMERLRWAPREFERPPIVVNIPEFRLRADDGEFHWALSMNVVVGKAYKHKTPVFESHIQAVVFRPYWNVPLSISRAELIPHIEKDPSYLAANSYEIADNRGNVISVDSPSPDLLARVEAGQLRIRQRPGPDNALGLLKFDIPSIYDVYMHGTPATALFARTRRDFSHGCIRVEGPVALAKWVLRGQGDWDDARILAAMNGNATFDVKLDRPIPVLIVYGTAVVMENGEVHFLRDIYGYDEALAKALALRHSEPAGTSAPSL